MNQYGRVIRSAQTNGGDFVEIWWCSSLVTYSSGTPFQLAIVPSTNLVASQTGIAAYEVSGITGVDSSGPANSTATVTALTATNSGADTGAKDFVVAGLALSFQSTSAINNPLANTSVNQARNQIGYQVNSASGGTDSAAWTWTTAARCAGAIASFISANATVVQAVVPVTSGIPPQFFITMAMPTAGNALIVVVSGGDGPGNGTTINSITDNLYFTGGQLLK